MRPNELLSPVTLVLARLAARGGTASVGDVFRDFEAAGLTLHLPTVHRAMSQAAHDGFVVQDTVPFGAAPALRGRTFRITTTGRTALNARGAALDTLRQPQMVAQFAPLSSGNPGLPGWSR